MYSSFSGHRAVDTDWLSRRRFVAEVEKVSLVGATGRSDFVAIQNSSLDAPVFSSSLWGPSGDDLDQVVEHCLLPELNIGDWLIFSQAGAYSLGQPLCAATDSPPPPVYYVITSGDWYEMQDSGITHEATLKNFSLVPYFLNSCQTETALSVPS